MAKDHERGETQDVRVDPKQRASNTGDAPKVDDKDLKQVEDHGSQGLRRLTQGEWSQVSKWKVRHVHFNLLQFEEKLPRFVIPRKFAPNFKLSQKNCDFLNYVILCLSDTRRCGTQQCRPDKSN